MTPNHHGKRRVAVSAIASGALALAFTPTLVLAESGTAGGHGSTMSGDTGTGSMTPGNDATLRGSPTDRGDATESMGQDRTSQDRMNKDRMGTDAESNRPDVRDPAMQGSTTGTSPSTMRDSEATRTNDPSQRTTTGPASTRSTDEYGRDKAGSGANATVGSNALDVDDDILEKNAAEVIAAKAFPKGAVEASDDFGSGWEVTGEDVDLKVDAEDGVLTVTGSIDSQSRISQIDRALKDVPGIKSVKNELELEESEAAE